MPLHRETLQSARAAEESLTALLGFGASVQRLDDSALASRYDELLDDYRASPSNGRAIKLSLLLSQSDARPEALSEAVTLLANASQGDGREAELGRILYQMTSARYLAVADRTALATMLEEERAHGARLEVELVKTRAALEIARRDREALERKLDALKAIEEAEPRLIQEKK